MMRNRFVIFLQAVSERPQTIEKPHEGLLPRGSETILLAEDDGELRKVTARVLTSLGYRVLQASDGIEAMGIAQRHEGTIDLLATDIVMPSMDGHDFAHLLSAMHSGITVLFMSGYTSDEVGRGELGLGNAFL